VQMNRLIVGMTLGALLAGCYTLQPAGGVVPSVGTQVAFDVNDVGRLALGGSMGPEIGQIEGRVVQKAECRPPPSDRYMKMKISEIQKVNQPEKTVKQMDKAVVKYKPIAQHVEAVQAQKQKKEGKNVRLEKQQLMELIFHAFEKHQYYKLVDLARITAQPPTYVKEILAEIGQYNTSPTNRFTWELKPEYRHYKDGDGPS